MRLKGSEHGISRPFLQALGHFFFALILARFINYFAAR